MIPKIIHRMWLDKIVEDNMVPPKKYKPAIETFDKYNPDFKVEFWNMGKVKSLFNKYPINPFPIFPAPKCTQVGFSKVLAHMSS